MKVSREWATPLTIGLFILMAVTGILMFFHLDSRLNKLAHEWLGWLFVVGVVAHAAANWTGVKYHFLMGSTGLYCCSLLYFIGRFIFLFAPQW